ncbi:MAG: hypothetical protein IKL80_02320, partial [Clostridia bacterium]|nr:hypothetical protein [Clostridia bacterium]
MNMILTEDERLIVNYRRNNGGSDTIQVYDVSHVTKGQDMQATATAGMGKINPGKIAEMVAAGGYLFVSVGGKENDATKFYTDVYDINNLAAKSTSTAAFRLEGFSPDAFWASGDYLFTRGDDKSIINIYSLSSLIENKDASKALVREGVSLAQGDNVHSIAINDKHLFVSSDEFYT